MYLAHWLSTTHSHQIQPITIGKWMIWIWFGLDGTGIDESPDFHWVLGPTLMIMFAFLGNTLFLTILVSMLSNTFSMIVRNAVQEIQFRRAVLTFEGVKADAIFAYFPPFNILALVIFLPLKQLIGPRMFHKVNVAAVKTLNAPILLAIAWYERRTLWVAEKHKHIKSRRIDWTNPFGPRAVSKGWWARMLTYWDFSRFSVHGDLQAVFDITAPNDLLDRDDNDDDHEEQRRKQSNGLGKMIIDGFNKQFGFSEDPRNDGAALSSRKLSVNPKDKKRPRRESSLAAADKSRSRSRTKSADAKLREEFADSESGEEGGDEADGDHPKGYKKIKKGERMDSLIDFSDNSAAMQEANARLHKMEDSLQRLEELVMQLVNGGDADNQAAENELKEEQRTGTLE